MWDISVDALKHAQVVQTGAGVQGQLAGPPPLVSGASLINGRECAWGLLLPPNPF